MKEAKEISAILKEHQEIDDMYSKLERYLNSSEDELVKLEGDSGKLPIIRLRLEWLRDALRLVRDYKLEPIKGRLEEQIGKMYFATNPEMSKKSGNSGKKTPAMTTYS